MLKKLPKWGLITGGVLIGGIVLLVILVSVIGDSEDDALESPIILSGEEFQSMSKDEFEAWIRSNRQDLSEDGIQRNLANFEEHQAAQRRWTAQRDHWENLDAFDQAISRIQEDRVVDATEASHICSVAPQWTEQMEAALKYIRDYRQHDPDLVTKTPSLHKLESDGTAKADFVADLIANCP